MGSEMCIRDRQMPCTVPAGTQHGPREPQCCACTPSMQNFGNANTLHRASRHTAQLERAIVLCMHSKHAKIWQCKCTAPCQQARSTARESHSAVHALQACKTLAMQMHCTVPAGTQHGSREPQCCACIQSMQTWQCKSIAQCQHARSTARESHNAVHALEACKTWQCNCIAPCQQAHSTARESHSAEPVSYTHLTLPTTPYV